LSKVLDFLSKTIGAIMVRGASLWDVLVPSTDGNVLRDRGVGQTPIWDTLTHVIDKNLGSTRGSLITRGSTAWGLFTPGTAGYLLSSQGAGADLHWIAPITAANPTATAKDTAVNGTATTFMRSDAAPAVQKATTTVFGIVKPDGTTCTITGGVLTASGTAYTLPTATTSVLGGVKVDGTTISINGSGVISSASGYTLPTASTSTLGGVKVDGTTITIASGVISASGGGSGNTYGLGLPLVTGESSGVAALIADTFGRTIGTLDGDSAFALLFPHAVFTSRPASLNAPTGGCAGFLASDTGKFYIWTGAAYTLLN
jgi:hypothetical protein